ncbi:MAG: ankyrin repeat domain-containing protein [Gemmatimonadaceae bacterium]|nr:ankyrin repeat domain-containing protein [Gemmatimonadaceae bacterium]
MSHLSSIDASANGEPFLAAFEAGTTGDWSRVAQLLGAHPELLRARGTNGNSLLNLAGALIPCVPPAAEPAGLRDLHAQTRLAPIQRLLDAGADVHLANVRGWTPLHQAGYRNDVALAELLLSAGARTDVSAHGDGGTPLVAALFWGHAEVAAVLAAHELTPRNLRVAAALGHVDLAEQVLNNVEQHRAFYRPHSGFPYWKPKADRQEVLNEALAWAARSGATAVMPLLIANGAQIDADTYRGTPLTWAAWAGRVDTATWLLDHGADVNAHGTFGGLQHGAGVTAAHLAAQNDRMDVLSLLVDRGADLSITDQLYGGTPRGWAEHDGKMTAAEFLSSRGG